MFSGIIKDLGKYLFSIKKEKTIAVESNLKDIYLGQSISCSGICLTVSKIKKREFYCNLSEETILKTNLYKKSW